MILDLKLQFHLIWLKEKFTDYEEVTQRAGKPEKRKFLNLDSYLAFWEPLASNSPF